MACPRDFACNGPFCDPKTAYGDSVGQISAGINADQVAFSRDRDEFGGRIWRVRKAWSRIVRVFRVYSRDPDIRITPVKAGAMRARAQAVGAGRGPGPAPADHGDGAKLSMRCAQCKTARRNCRAVSNGIWVSLTLFIGAGTAGGGRGLGFYLGDFFDQEVAEHGNAF